MRLLFVFLGVLCSIFGYGQEPKMLLFDEFSVSANYSDVIDSNTSNGLGFGIGVYHNFRKDKSVRFKFGIEYNETRQTKKYTHEGRFASGYNMTFKLRNLSIPVTSCIYFGKQIKFNFETGIFTDLNLGSTRIGTVTVFDPTTGESTSEETKGIVKLANSNFGVSFGVGICFPLKNYELILRPEYRYGFNNLDIYFDEIKNRYIRIMVGFRIKGSR